MAAGDGEMSLPESENDDGLPSVPGSPSGGEGSEPELPPVSEGGTKLKDRRQKLYQEVESIFDSKGAAVYLKWQIWGQPVRRVFWEKAYAIGHAQVDKLVALAKGGHTHAPDAAPKQVRNTPAQNSLDVWCPSLYQLLTEPLAVPGSGDTVEMRAAGMRSPPGSPIRKRTRITTNSTKLAGVLHTKQCTRDHVHRQIKGGELGRSLGRWCQVYPDLLCEILAESFC